jgi:hypothetical protein
MAGMTTSVSIEVDLVESLRLNVYPERPMRGFSGVIAQITVESSWVCLTGPPERVAGLLRELADKVDAATRERESRDDRGD